MQESLIGTLGEILPELHAIDHDGGSLSWRESAGQGLQEARSARRIDGPTQHILVERGQEAVVAPATAALEVFGRTCQDCFHIFRLASVSQEAHVGTQPGWVGRPMKNCGEETIDN